MGQQVSKRGIGWIILLGLCLLLVGAVLLVPRWIDWTQYRNELTDLIGDVTGRRVAIDGDVRLTLLPTPSFRAEEVRLGEAAGERSPIFLRADAIQADLDLGALLVGTVRVSSLRVEHPVAEFLDLPTGTDFLGFGRATLERVSIIDGEVGSPLMDSGDRLTGIDADLTFGKPGDAPRLTATFRHRTLPWRMEASLGRALSMQVGPRGGGPTLRLTGMLAEEGGARFIGKLKGEGTRATELAHLLGFGVPKPAEGRFALDASVDLTANGLSLHDLSVALGEQRLAGNIALAWTDHITWRASLRTARLDLDALRKPWQPPLVPRVDSSLPHGTLTLAADAVEWRSGVLRQARVSAAWEDGIVTLAEAAVVLPGGTDIALSGAVLPDENWRFAGRGEFGGDDPRPALVWAGLDPRWFPRGDRVRRVSGTLALSGDRDSLVADHLDLGLRQALGFLDDAGARLQARSAEHRRALAVHDPVARFLRFRDFLLERLSGRGRLVRGLLRGLLRGGLGRWRRFAGLHDLQCAEADQQCGNECDSHDSITPVSGLRQTASSNVRRNGRARHC